jgi:hypothetical protein
MIKVVLCANKEFYITFRSVFEIINQITTYEYEEISTIKGCAPCNAN